MSSTKTVLITGAATGVGYALALELAKLKYRVYVSARTKVKAEDAVKRLKEESEFPDAFIAAPALELDDVKKVRQFVAEFEPKLDGLVLNAGVVAPKRILSGDGVELTFAAKVVGHHVLTIELTKKESLRAGAVILFIGSESSTGKLPMTSYPNYREIARTKKGGDLESTYVSVLKCDEEVIGKHKYISAQTSAQAFGELWVYSLAPRFAEKGIKVFASSPGCVTSTETLKNLSWIGRMMVRIIAPLILGDQTPEDAVRQRFVPFFKSPEKFEPGRFYASPLGKAVGPLTLQEIPHLTDRESADAVVRAVETVSGTRSDL